MTVLSWAALTYVVIGLALAALIYHAMSGGLDDAFDDTPCEDCGKPHQLSDEARETAHTLDRLRVLRETDRGRLSVAIVTAVMCLAVTLGWPVLIAWLVYQRANEKRS